MTSGNGVMEKLIDYVSKARTSELPPEVLRKTKHHILDTLAAMISGAQIKPGEMALKYARLQEGGARDAQVATRRGAPDRFRGVHDAEAAALFRRHGNLLVRNG